MKTERDIQADMAALRRRHLDYGDGHARAAWGRERGWAARRLLLEALTERIQALADVGLGASLDHAVSAQPALFVVRQSSLRIAIHEASVDVYAYPLSLPTLRWIPPDDFDDGRACADALADALVTWMVCGDASRLDAFGEDVLKHKRDFMP